MVSQLWVNYRASSLSQEVLPWKPWRSWPLHAGDRLPFLTLASTGKSTTTLDLKRGTSFVLVLFCSSEGAADLRGVSEQAGWARAVLVGALRAPR